MDAVDKCKEASLLLALLLSRKVTPMLQVQRSSGCFRWIKLVFEGLQRVHTARGIREVLKGVPSEMAESYKRALKHVSQRCTERRLLASSLAWTVYNTGPLTVAELQNILEAT